jgi:hypothetical protein
MVHILGCVAGWGIGEHASRTSAFGHYRCIEVLESCLSRKSDVGTSQGRLSRSIFAVGGTWARPFLPYCKINHNKREGYIMVVSQNGNLRWCG